MIIAIVLAVAVVTLVLHQAAETMLCVGPNAHARRYWWRLATSAALIVGMFSAWAVVFSTVAWRGDYGGLTLALSPIVVVFALGNAYLARLAHDEVTLAVATADGHGDSHTEDKVRR